VLAIGLAAEELSEVAAILEPQGYRLVVPKNCEMAWRVLHRERIDAVLLDDCLHELSWKDVLREFTDIADAPAVIVTSRSADENLWLEVLTAGAFDLLAKPISRTELLRVIAQACPAPARLVSCA
jgi:DNA-binding response OmpR family regulator